MNSPQLRAIGPVIRILAVYIDAIAAYGDHCPAVDGRIESAILAESGRGKTLSWAEQTMAERGWRTPEEIFNAAGIPDKHRRVIELACWGDPTKHKGRMFTTREIASMTGHPERTVMRWLSEDMPRLRLLGEVA